MMSSKEGGDFTPSDNKRKLFFKVCDCGKEYNVSSSFYAHKKNCSGEMKLNEIETKKYLCIEKGCNFKSKISDEFLKHLLNIHEIESTEDVKVFQDYSEFETWKEKFEIETKVAFLEHGTRRTLKGKTAYFYCNRSGIYESVSTGIRSLKPQGLRKIGFNCPASIRVHVDKESDKVTAVIRSMHYGHDIDPLHLPINRRKKIVAHELSQGIDYSRVLQNLCLGKITEAKRKLLCNKRGILHSKTSDMQEMIVEDNSDSSIDEHHCMESNSESLNLQDIDMEHSMSNNILRNKECFENEFVLKDINPEDRNIEIIKQNLLKKHMQLCEKIKNCNNRESLITARQHINNAYHILEMSKDKSFSVKSKNVKVPNKKRVKQHRVFAPKKPRKEKSKNCGQPTPEEKLDLEYVIVNNSQTELLDNNTYVVYYE